MLHKGLEEVVFSNLGEDTPCLPTILTHGQTLRDLKLHAYNVNHTARTEKRRSMHELEDVGHISTACPYLCHLVVDPHCNDSGLEGALAWKVSVGTQDDMQELER